MACHYADSAWSGIKGGKTLFLMSPLRGTYTIPCHPPPYPFPECFGEEREQSREGRRVALKVILHVSTGMGPRPPCTLAPSLDHNTGSIDSWASSFPRCLQSCGFAVPAHRPLTPKDPPKEGVQS